MLDLRKVLTAKPKPHDDAKLAKLVTPWGEKVDRAQPLPEHPAPHARRTGWMSLNGPWQCAFKDGAPSVEDLPNALINATKPAELSQVITVPFSPEAPLSGVDRQLSPSELLWYERDFGAPNIPTGWRVMLHFEAVDYACAVWLNDTLLGTHQGGYLPFAFDVTNALLADGNNLCVCVADPSEQGGQLRGKQRLDRGDIWYTAQSGIWQSVWLEWMPERHVADFTLEASYQARCLRIQADAPELSVRVIDGAGTEVASAVASPQDGSKDDGLKAANIDAGKSNADGKSPTKTGCATKFHGTTQGKLVCEIPLSDAHPWSPDDPYLYRIELTCGEDVVESYCGFRDVEVKADATGTLRLYLNGAPLFLKGILDQGYWPDGLMTAPSDDALVFDIEAARAAGFNMMRKHIKIESARWYYHCDRLGMLVWQDMVSGGGVWDTWHVSYKPTLFKASWDRYDDRPTGHQRHLLSDNARYRDEWTGTMLGTIELLRRHPCIVTWVLFNEGWGQFDARSALKAARAADPTRPIDAVSGWYDQHCGDFKSVHNYFRPLEVWPDKGKRAFVISEFGGLTLAVAGHTSLSDAYGYATYESDESWRESVRAMLAHMDTLEVEGLAGYVYTQLSDVEEEVNGILTYDRRINKMEKQA